MMPRSLAITRPELGHQRWWIWRGWRIRYTYLMPTDPTAQKAIPMLLLHGFGSSLEQWRHNLIPLSQDRPVYALDLLGFGGAQKPACLLGVNLWQAQVFDFWQAIIQQPVMLMGHSLGALVALTTAVAHPTMAHRLILLTLPLARQELVGGWLEVLSRRVESLFASPVLLRPLFKLVRQPWFIRSALAKIYLNPDRVDDQLVSSFTRPTLDRGAARTLCYLVSSRTEADFSPAIQAVLPQVQVPILLLWGQQDRIVPFGWAARISSLSPRLRLITIDRAGHCLYDEAAEQVNAVIRHWLESSPA
jgi:pimeloyl-ACP methyl ester carboxylesterase